MNPPDTFPRPQPLPSTLADAWRRAAPRLAVFARAPLWYAELGSTNDVAADLAERGAAEGAVVVADAQTAGRGRLGRHWCSPPGAGLYVSVVLQPAVTVVPLITIAAGVAVVEGIHRGTGLRATLKWPNDVLVGTRKLAGILAEGTGSHVVLGFGVNVRPAAYAPDVAIRATSLETEIGRHVDRDIVLTECVAALASRYDDLQSGRAAAVLDAWRSHARPLLGKAVEWNGEAAPHAGIAENIDESGALLIRTPRGILRVMSGEVRWR